KYTPASKSLIFNEILEVLKAIDFTSFPVMSIMEMIELSILSVAMFIISFAGLGYKLNIGLAFISSTPTKGEFFCHITLVTLPLFSYSISNTGNFELGSSVHQRAVLIVSFVIGSTPNKMAILGSITVHVPNW